MAIVQNEIGGIDLMHEIECQRWIAFCEYHNLLHPKRRPINYYYESHPTGIGNGLIAVCPICLQKKFKKLRDIKPKENFTYYECW